MSVAQAALDRGVDVLILHREIEGAGLDLVPDQPETAFDLGGFLGSDDALLAEHAHMRHRPANILTHHAIVEENRGSELRGNLVRRGGENVHPRVVSVPMDPLLLGHAEQTEDGPRSQRDSSRRTATKVTTNQAAISLGTVPSLECSMR